MAVKVAILVEKLVGLVEDSRVNDEVFRKSKELFGCLKLMLKEADRVLRFVSVSASEWLKFGLKIFTLTRVNVMYHFAICATVRDVI